MACPFNEKGRMLVHISDLTLTQKRFHVMRLDETEEEFDKRLEAYERYDHE